MKRKSVLCYMKRKSAKIIRIITAPPFMAMLMLLLLHHSREEYFINRSDYFAALFGLGILPLLAYPIQYLIPFLKSKGREAQRKLAFILSVIGYLAFMVYTFLHNSSSQLTCISVFYALSVVILSIINKATPIRASGHSCSFAAMPLCLIFYVSWVYLVPGVILGSAMVWSSLELKRHTMSDLIYGFNVSILAFIISKLIFGI